MGHAHLRAITKPESPLVAENSSPIRVFLINGHRSILWGLERLIESRQPAMQVAGSATSCADALERIDDASPDLILLDIDSAHEDGVVDIPRLMAKSHAKILVLSGLRDESLLDQVMLAGASGLVRKEAPAQTILIAIEKVHEGQLWLDRVTTGRIMDEFSRKSGAQAADPEQAKIARLTDRETEVVALAASHAGANGKTLARMLNISEHTLRNHLTSIYDKLNVSNRIEMFAYAHQRGLTLDS
jgi:two-component system, NarL family, nitrate/nitrite response regulator NarL